MILKNKDNPSFFHNNDSRNPSHPENIMAKFTRRKKGYSLVHAISFTAPRPQQRPKNRLPFLIGC